MLEITDEIILQDIADFKKRIQKAKGQLSELPETDETWRTREDLKKKRRILTSEIEHVKRLIGIAGEAPTDV